MHTCLPLTIQLKKPLPSSNDTNVNEHHNAFPFSSPACAITATLVIWPSQLKLASLAAVSRSLLAIVYFTPQRSLGNNPIEARETAWNCGNSSVNSWSASQRSSLIQSNPSLFGKHFKTTRVVRVLYTCKTSITDIRHRINMCSSNLGFQSLTSQWHCSLAHANVALHFAVAQTPFAGEMEFYWPGYSLATNHWPTCQICLSFWHSVPVLLSIGLPASLWPDCYLKI